MDRWTCVKWTEAAQVAELMDLKEDLGADARTAPAAFFAKLRAGGRRHDAAFFLGQALPRLETVAWAARAVRDLTMGAATMPGDADALKAALLFIQDPSDARRRAAFEAADGATSDSAQRMAALAVFFSGGSVAPADAPPVPAPKEAAGRFAAGAVVLAAIQSGDMDKALDAALDAGDALAERGLSAGAA